MLLIVCLERARELLGLRMCWTLLKLAFLLYIAHANCKQADYPLESIELLPLSSQFFPQQVSHRAGELRFTFTLTLFQKNINLFIKTQGKRFLRCKKTNFIVSGVAFLVSLSTFGLCILRTSITISGMRYSRTSAMLATLSAFGMDGHQRISPSNMTLMRFHLQLLLFSYLLSLSLCVSSQRNVSWLRNSEIQQLFPYSFNSASETSSMKTGIMTRSGRKKTTTAEETSK